jgi:hypothetical protein
MKRTNRDAGQRVIDSRLFQVRAESVNEEDRSIDAIIASETPVNEMDWNRYEIVPRVLLASGAEYPKSGQVPLLDSHNRYSVESQLGSIRNLKTEGTAIVGKLTFSETAKDAWTKVREGHVTDVSAGFQVLSEVYIPEKTTQRIKGRDFTGPMNVATKWRIYEGSITPIGADEAAKMRGLDLANLPVPQKGNFTMNPELRKRCIAAGMDANLTDEQALAWLNANAERAFAAAPALAAAPVVAPATTAVDVSGLTRSISEQITKDLEAREALREKARQDQLAALERDVDATLELTFGSVEAIPTGLRSLSIASGSMVEARKLMAEAKKKRDEETRLAPFSGGNIEHIAAQRDKHREVLQTALLVRAADLRGYGVADKTIPVANRPQGWDQFRNAPLIEIARECLIADGYSYQDVRGLSRQNLAIAALGWPHKVGLRAAGYAYHTTGSLALITLDAINKNLTTGYNEAPSTWRGPMRQAASVPDFKQKHIIKMGAVGNLPIWQDNKAPHEAALANEKESYCVEARAETLSFSWQLYVNDDMDALSRGPALLGAAAARTVNAVAWAQVTSNPVMSDGQALFLETAAGNRKRSNYTTGSATPTVTTLGVMRNKMRQMRGLNTPEGNESQDVLNIMPRYLVVPGALETLAEQLINSIADPAIANSAVHNPMRTLTQVTEPLLDAATDGTTAFYLFADPGQVDTIEVTFLQGQETPVLNDYVDEATWSRKVMVVQSFAAKAADHRGVQKHKGAS